ncbi:MAG: hypothetical protein IJW94_04225 [Oscillospiraceae bacterium]|nr:hypothetical protein [Oscillospiraceae bacterium]
MFGYVTANVRELSKEQSRRYNAVYCGICRQIRNHAGQLARLGLSYDMAFLALLLMSLYEPEEVSGKRACALHPVSPKPWIDNEYIAYAADMNVALAYYKAADDWHDDKKQLAKMMTGVFGKHLEEIQERYPRQCQAISQCISQLTQLEKDNCDNPDLPAGCFGGLMGELLCYREDLWADTLRKMGVALGRFVYLADAARDYKQDKRKKKYNPFLAMGGEQNWQHWNEYLVLAMGSCTHEFEKLPLVQDKGILDNILYSGVWVSFSAKTKEQEGAGS